jgi:hypothetical protein
MSNQLNKENYEFLMFELLEGNLNETEKNDLLIEINANPFYQKEWQLMQFTLVTADNQIGMPNRKALEKHDDKTLLLFTWPKRIAIAASLLLIGSFGIWYYSAEKTNSKLTNSSLPESSLKNSSETQPTSKTNIAPNKEPVISFKYNTSSQPETTAITSKFNPLPKLNIIDSAHSNYQPELLRLYPIETDKIAYQSPENTTQQTELFSLTPPLSKNPGKMQKLLVKANAIGKTTQLIWNDLPNLTFKMSPNLKSRNRSIGIEIKGETIYANAVIELK